jgi:hypothetical protein
MSDDQENDGSIVFETERANKAYLEVLAWLICTYCLFLALKTVASMLKFKIFNVRSCNTYRNKERIVYIGASNQLHACLTAEGHKRNSHLCFKRQISRLYRMPNKFIIHFGVIEKKFKFISSHCLNVKRCNCINRALSTTLSEPSMYH